VQVDVEKVQEVEVEVDAVKLKLQIVLFEGQKSQKLQSEAVNSLEAHLEGQKSQKVQSEV